MTTDFEYWRAMGFEFGGDLGCFFSGSFFLVFASGTTVASGLLVAGYSCEMPSISLASLQLVRCRAFFEPLWRVFESGCVVVCLRC